MVYNVYPPSQELEHIVRQIVVIDSFDNIDKMLFIPNGGNFILFNRGIKGFFHSQNNDNFIKIYPGYCITKKTHRVKRVILDPKNNLKTQNFPIIAVELLPLGFYKLFKTDFLSDNIHYLKLSKEIKTKYFSDLYKHNTIEEEISYLNDSLKSLYLSHENEHLCIEDVIRKISDEYHYDVSVENLLREFNCSRSTMERQFKKIVGLTPKKFIFVGKFCKTLLSYVNDDCTFKELPYHYSDSSHMNAVFKKFIGLTPSETVDDVKSKKILIYQAKQVGAQRFED